MRSTRYNVRIIAIPPGEAPLWVREQWVGLELPLAQTSTSALAKLTAGVLSGPRTVLASLGGYLTGRYHREVGFIVPVLAALKVLEVSSPEAADWWRTNAPHLCKRWRCFMFHAHVCEVASAKVV